MQDDFGYFGKGASGYAHYNQTFNSCFGGSGNSGTGKHSGNSADDVSWGFIFKLFGLAAVVLFIDYLLILYV